MLLRDRRGAHRRVRVDQHPGGRAVHAADVCNLHRVRPARRQARHGERAGVSAAGRGRRAGVRGLSRRVRVPARHDGRLPRRLCAADAHHHLRAGALGAGPVGVRALGGRGAARVLCVRNGVVSHRLHPHGRHHARRGAGQVRAAVSASGRGQARTGDAAACAAVPAHPRVTKRLYGEKHRPKRPVFFCSVLFSEGSVPVVRTGDADVGGVELGVLALLALAHVVLEHGQTLVAEDEDDRDVDDDHRALEHVGRIPREAGADDGADEHERRRSQTEHRHARLARVAPKDILQAALAVIVVADERREREQAHGHGDEDGAEAAERLLHGRLHIGRAGRFLGRLNAGAQAHERRGRADEQRVDEHGQHLHEALLGRVRDVGRGGRVRRRAHAGLIGVQAALDAPHDARTSKAAERRLEIERIAEDVGDDAREDLDVHENDDERHEDVQHAHDRHEHARDIGQALAAAEHARGEQHRQDRADDVRRAALGVEAKASEGVLQIVGREHVVADHIGQDEHDGKNDAEPALVQRLLHVIRRAADAAALAVLFLIDLRKRGLDEGARPAEQRHDPHPEHGAEAAEADGRGHADDIAGADARRRGHHERAERGNA